MTHPPSGISAIEVKVGGGYGTVGVVARWHSPGVAQRKGVAQASRVNLPFFSDQFRG